MRDSDPIKKKKINFSFRLDKRQKQASSIVQSIVGILLVAANWGGKWFLILKEFYVTFLPHLMNILTFFKLNNDMF